MGVQGYLPPHNLTDRRIFPHRFRIVRRTLPAITDPSNPYLSDEERCYQTMTLFLPIRQIQPSSPPKYSPRKFSGLAYKVFPSQRRQRVGKDSGKTRYVEGCNCILRQRVLRLGRKVLSFSKKLENPIAPIGFFVHPYNALLSVWHYLSTFYREGLP